MRDALFYFVLNCRLDVSLYGIKSHIHYSCVVYGFVDKIVAFYILGWGFYTIKF